MHYDVKKFVCPKDQQQINLARNHFKSRFRRRINLFILVTSLNKDIFD